MKSFVDAVWSEPATTVRVKMFQGGSRRGGFGWGGGVVGAVVVEGQAVVRGEEVPGMAEAVIPRSGRSNRLERERRRLVKRLLTIKQLILKSGIKLWGNLVTIKWPWKPVTRVAN